MVSIQKKNMRGGQVRLAKMLSYCIGAAIGCCIIIILVFSTSSSSPSATTEVEMEQGQPQQQQQQQQQRRLDHLLNDGSSGGRGGGGVVGVINNIRRRHHEGHNEKEDPQPSLQSSSPSLLVRPVQRIDATKVSFNDFQANFALGDVATQPVVLENCFQDTFDELQWTRQFIAQECGDVSLYYQSNCKDCHNVQFVNPKLLGREWAALQLADLEELGISTLGELMELQDQPDGHNLYLHDATMSHYCPSALERLQVPRYFTINYDYLEWDLDKVGKIELDHGYPRMFISKKGSGSPLHIDGGMTRFWVQQLSGHKLWRLFPPSEFWRFGPDWREDDHFQVDAMNPDFEKYPLLNGALVYETVLTPGEVIFVPESWAHQVLNLDDAISHGVNYVDWNFMPSFLNNWKQSYRKDLEYVEDLQIQLFSAFFMPLDPQPKREENLNFHEYFESHHLALMKQVPAAVKKFVKGRTLEQIDEYRDIAGRPAIVVATIFHFTSVVEYLLEEVKDINVNEPDIDECTALDYAIDSKALRLSALLAKHGGLQNCFSDKNS